MSNNKHQNKKQKQKKAQNKLQARKQPSKQKTKTNNDSKTYDYISLSEFNLGAYKYVTRKVKKELTSFYDSDIIVFTEAHSKRNRIFLEKMFSDSFFLWHKIRNNDYIGIFINNNEIQKDGRLQFSLLGGYVILPLAIQNFKFHLFAAHLRWKTNRNSSRELCFKALTEFQNVILVGDLNIEPNDIYHHEHFPKDEFSIAFKQNDPTTTTAGGRKDNVIFMKKKFSLVNKSVGKFCSDHYPVTVKLKYAFSSTQSKNSKKNS
eukprot:gene7658-11978_t